MFLPWVFFEVLALSTQARAASYPYSTYEEHSEACNLGYAESAVNEHGLCVKWNGEALNEFCEPCLVGQTWDTLRRRKGFSNVEGARSQLVLELAEWVGAQLHTSVMRIILEEMMAYDKVSTLLTPDAEEVVSRVSSGCVDVAPEVWDFDDATRSRKDHNTVMSTDLGTVRKNFWYVNEAAVSGENAALILDHYRSLRLNAAALQKLPASGAREANESVCEEETKPRAWADSTCADSRFTPDRCVKTPVTDSSEEDLRTLCVEAYAGSPDKEMVSWAAGQIVAAQLNVSVLFVGTDELMKIVEEANANTEPILFNWYEPHPVHAFFPSIPVTFPQHSNPCAATHSADPVRSQAECNSKGDYLQTLVNVARVNADADLEDFLRAYTIDTEMQTEMFKLDTRGGGALTTEKAACAWVRNNSATWLSWVATNGQPPTCDSRSVLVDGACVECRNGSQANDEEECEVCPAGTHWDDVTFACVQCPIRGYQETAGGRNAAGEWACEQCPLNSVRDPESKSTLRACLCLPSFYASVWNRTSAKSDDSGTEWGVGGSPCARCPEGARCAGGLEPPRNRKDFWGDDQQPVEFYECLARECEPSYECSAGFQGTRCTLISSAMTHLVIAGIDGNFECPAQKWLWTIVSSSAVVALWIVINYVILPRCASFDIFLSYAQQAAIVSRYNPNAWPKAMIFVGPFFELLLFDIDIVPPSCVYVWRPHHGFYIQIILLWGGTLRFIPIWYSVWWRLVQDPAYRSYTAVKQSFSFYDDSEHKFGQRISKAFTGLCTLIAVQYPTITYNSLDVMRCEHMHVKGKELWVMSFDPNYECGSQRQVALSTVGALIFVLVSLGVPLALCVTIHYEYARHLGVHAPHILARWGWAFESYKTPLHWWRVVSYAAMTSFCACATLLEDEWMQIAFTALVSSTQLVLIFAYKPLIQKTAMRLEIGGCLYTLLFNISIVPAWSSSPDSLYSQTWNVMLYLATAVLIGGTFFGARKDQTRGRHLRYCVAKLEQQLGAVVHLNHHSSIAGHLKGAGAKVFDRLRPLSTPRKSLGSNALAKVLEFTKSMLRPSTPRPSVGSNALAAVLEFTNSIERSAMYAWCHHASRVPADFKLFETVAQSAESFVADTSPTSCFSIENRAGYYRTIVESNPGILNFVVELSQNERQIYLGMLCRLERIKKRNPVLNHYRHMIDERDRSSLLFYLLVASQPQVDDFTALMGQIHDSSSRTDVHAEAMAQEANRKLEEQVADEEHKKNQMRELQRRISLSDFKDQKTEAKREQLAELFDSKEWLALDFLAELIGTSASIIAAQNEYEVIWEQYSDQGSEHTEQPRSRQSQEDPEQSDEASDGKPTRRRRRRRRLTDTNTINWFTAVCAE